MDLLKPMYLCAIIAASAMISDMIRCAPIKRTQRCKDIAEAMNLLSETMPTQMTLDERCKRFAVLSSILSAAKGRPQSRGLSQVLSMSEDDLSAHYENLTLNNELMAAYMVAIDGYRSSFQLGPPFLDLIACLKQIGTPQIRPYLNNPELKLTERTYKKTIQSPDIKIDLDSIDFRKFTPAFQTSFIHLFRRNLQNDTWVTRHLMRHGEQPNTTDQHYPEMTLDETRHMIRTLGRNDPRRMVTTHRHREQERLRKQRLRILQPIWVGLERARHRERRRRNRQLKSEQRQQSDPVTDPVPQPREMPRHLVSRMSSLAAPGQLEDHRKNYRHHMEYHDPDVHPEHQQTKPTLERDQSKSDEVPDLLSPDLAHLWSIEAPTLDLIMPPIVSYPHVQQQQSGVDQLLGQPSVSDSTRVNPQTGQISSNMPATQSELTPTTFGVPQSSLGQSGMLRQQPLERPTTRFPGFSQIHSSSVSSVPSPREPEYVDTTHSYDTGIGARFEGSQNQIDSNMRSSTSKSDDGDLLTQSFLNTRGSSNEEGESFRPWHDFEQNKPDD